MNGTGHTYFQFQHGGVLPVSLVQAPVPRFPILGAGHSAVTTGTGCTGVLVQARSQPLPCASYQSAPEVISEVKQTRLRNGKVRTLPMPRSPLKTTPTQLLKRKMIPVSYSSPHPPPPSTHPLYERISKGMNCTTFTHYEMAKLDRRCRPLPVYYCERQKKLKIRKSKHSTPEDAEVAGINESRLLKDTMDPTSLKNTCFKSIWYEEEKLQEARNKEMEELAMKARNVININNVVGNSGGSVVLYPRPQV